MQMFTGGGILISGFLTLRDNVSAYHWHIIVYLAWFSTTSHLAGLTTIRSHLHSFPRQKHLRLITILVIFMMLLTAMVPTQFFAWDLGMDKSLSGSATLCFFDFELAMRMRSKATDIVCEHEPSDSPCKYHVGHETTRGKQNMVTSIFLLLLGLLIRAMKMLSPLSGFLMRRLRRKSSESSRRFLFWLRPRRFISVQASNKRPTFLEDVYAYFFFLPVLAVFYSIRLWLDLLSSMLTEVRAYTVAKNWHFALKGTFS